MKKKVKDFIIQIDNKYLARHKMGEFNSEKTAIINLTALAPSVNLSDLADAIIKCTFDIEIDRELFSDLKINLTINKTSECKVKYTFTMPNYCATSDILPAIAEHLTL